MALTALASCVETVRLEPSCVGWRELKAENGSYLVGTEAWRRATTSAEGARLPIDPAVIERGGISIIGKDFGADLSSHNRYFIATCPQFSEPVPPPAG